MYLHENFDGTLTEYRRFPFDPQRLHVEARACRPDGSPGTDWRAVDATELRRLAWDGSDIPELLDAEVRPAA